MEDNGQKMGIENRTTERFQDFGRVDCQELCLASGILEDISLKGCKVTFNMPVSFDPDNEYEITVRLSRENLETLELLCKPQWSRTVDGTTEIGFAFLHSKDTTRLESYIKILSHDRDLTQPIIEDTSCQFV